MTPALSDMEGMWRRSLIAWPDGRRDVTTAVHWLQSASFYADLRQPADRPSFAGVGCLRQVRQDQIAWLARQEGFAGALLRDGTWFEWQRDLDFQPQSRYSDIGRLRFDGDMLIEEGFDVAYIEHWHRETMTDYPDAAARLRDRHNGCTGFLVRLGVAFMVARTRAFPLPPFRSLSDYALEAPSLQDAQDLVDCEISIGTVAQDGWVIENSSLPFKEGRRLCPVPLARSERGIETIDLDSNGAEIKRYWDVTDLRRSLGDLLACDAGDSQARSVGAAS